MKTIRILRIIHITVLAEVLVFFGVVLFLKQDSIVVWYNEENPALYMTGIITAIISAMSAFIIPHTLLYRIRAKESKEKRIKFYRPVAIVRMMLMDVAMTVCIIFFMIDNVWIYTLILAFLTLIFVELFPTRERMERETELSVDDFSDDDFDD
jgi:hypothetical protein